MRTSLNEIKLIDEHLLNNGSIENTLLFDALRIINPVLNEEITWQKHTHGVIKQYGRKKLKAEIDAVHRKLFNAPEHKSFRQRILGFFGNS